MASTGQNILEVLAPLETPLPELPSGEHFTALQWEILLAILDAVIPSIERESVSSKLALGRDHISVETISDAKYGAALAHLREKVVSPPAEEDIDVFLMERPSQIPEFEDLLKRTLIQYAREDARSGLRVILTTLRYV
jgi:hypothetical protein